VLAALARHLQGRLPNTAWSPPAPCRPGTDVCCAGSGNRNPRAPAARRSPRSSPRSSCAWPARTQPGATPEFRAS
jgi:hypothetical protein